MYPIGSGAMRIVLLKTGAVTDVIPVDMVINIAITAAWNKAISKATKDNLSIYNCVTGNQNPITWTNFTKAIVVGMRKYPLEDAVWYPAVTICSTERVYQLLTYLYQIVPATIFDFLAECVGKIPTYVPNKTDAMFDMLII